LHPKRALTKNLKLWNTNINVLKNSFAAAITHTNKAGRVVHLTGLHSPHCVHGFLQRPDNVKIEAQDVTEVMTRIKVKLSGQPARVFFFSAWVWTFAGMYLTTIQMNCYTCATVNETDEWTATTNNSSVLTMLDISCVWMRNKNWSLIHILSQMEVNLLYIGYKWS
jgi:hypothetical protein